MDDSFKTAAVDINSIALAAATAIMALPSAAALIGGEGQLKAKIQCAVRDALAQYKAAPIDFAPIPAALARIGERIRTQDNECTANAVFLVEQERIVTGIDTAYDPAIVWIIEDHMIFAGDEEFAALEEAYQSDSTIPQDYTRTGYIRQWEYLTVFFTRAAADAYIERHGRKFDGKLRVAIECDYRNTEFNFVREWLAGLPTTKGETS